MPPAHRVGDKALNPADAHGCPACPHPVQGPGTSGSPDVFVNNMPQMRVGDPGMHAACCGPNSWTVAQGSSSVFVNNIPPSRIGDATTHCGGSGKVIQGSPNVIIGDYTCAPPPPPPPAPPDLPNLVEAWPGAADFFINMPDDEGRKHGRKVTVKARVEPPQGGVPIFFKLLDVAGNTTANVPSGSEARLLTPQATTNGDGIAEGAMELSELGGDIGQVRASTEPDGGGTAVDTGVQVATRLLRFDITRMKKSDDVQPSWLGRTFAGRETVHYSMEEDLERATEGLARVAIKLEDSGIRHEGEYDPLMTKDKLLDWCKAACPPGRPSGDAPLVHLVVVPDVLGREWHESEPLEGKHLGGGNYAFDLPEPPYVEPEGHVKVRSSLGGRSDPPVFSNIQNFNAYPDRNRDGGLEKIVDRWLRVVPTGPLGTTGVTMDLSSTMPDRVKEDGAFPAVIHAINFTYAKIGGNTKGICLEGGQYVVVTERLDGDGLMHEIGHALGLAGGTKDESPERPNHCQFYSCVMYFGDIPSQTNDFHGLGTQEEGTCADWLRRLNMTKEHLYERWWGQGGWPYLTMTMADADGCPCTPPPK